MMKKRITGIILLMALLAAAASCGSEGTSVVTDTAEPVETTAPIETADPNDREHAADSLPDGLDFGGQPLRIFTRGGDPEVLIEFIAEEETGEVLNDAVLARNRSVEERLNITLDVMTTNSTRHDGDHEMIRQLILSGSDEYDIIANQRNYTVGLSVEGLFTDLNALPYLDFDKPWWNSAFMEMTEHRGRNFVCMGELAQTMISGIYCMFFNSTMFGEFYADEPSLYDTVMAGDWTLDKMMTYCSGIYGDLNGNSVADEGDRFGHYFRNGQSLGTDCYLGGCKVQLLTYDGSGNLVYNGTGETALTYVEKVHELIFNDNNTLRGSYNDATVMVPMASGNVLFTAWMLGGMSYLRDMEDDFGIIPMPKLDESQKDYNTADHNGSSVFCIPITCKSMDMTAAALEALCAESYRSVTPAYYEVVLKDKYSRDGETTQMLDMMVANIHLDLATIYGSSLGGWGSMFRKFFASASGADSALSTLAGKEKELLTKMQEVIDRLDSIES